jgi:hypothetical protein
LGLKSDTLFRQGTADWQPLRALAPTQGQRRYIQDVILTQRHTFGPVNLIADWTSEADTPRYVVTDQRADRHTWRRGRTRFWIEPFFRDWKSYGFDLESSKLVHPRRLETLLLGMATATLWIVHIDQWLIRTGRRFWLKARHKQDYSCASGYHYPRLDVRRVAGVQAERPMPWLSRSGAVTLLTKRSRFGTTPCPISGDRG